MKDLEARAGELFLEAMDLSTEEQGRFMERVGAEDPWLRDRVRQLLEADGSTYVERLDSRSGLGSWAAGFLDGEAPDWDRDPEQLGPFRIVRRLGVGGMGIVYEALQESPERSVALKILHPRSLRSETALRFEQEARVLGWLNHPGIAQIYSAGTSAASDREIPYFAMELIDGKTLLRYLADADPGRRARLELVAEIADAVHHAHQKGVVHRDLKPSNILVTAEGRPKILDFGVARLTDSDLQRSTLSTHAGEILGTLSYMSPEQLRGDVEAVDTRSDVYALGVLLYEVLTGELPHQLRGVALPKAARMLEEEEPTKPTAHDPALSGDLETILLEALAKDPDRRYSSAEEFSSDVRRFLRREPIVARTPSLAYQLLRFSQRHRAVALISALLLLVLIGSAILSTVLLLQARKAETAAVAESDRANEKAAVAERVAGLLVGLFEGADPDAPGGVSAQDLLDRGAQKLEEDEGLAPDIRAELSDAIGRSYRGLAEFEKAERWVGEGLKLRTQLYPRDSHPAGHPDLYRSLANMGSLEASLASLEPGLTKLEEAEAMLLELAGPFGPGSAPKAGEYEVPGTRAYSEQAGDLNFEDWIIVQDLLATAEVSAGKKEQALERVIEILGLARAWQDSPEWTEDSTRSLRSLESLAAFIEMSTDRAPAAEARLRNMVEEFDLAEGVTLARADHLMSLGKAVELQGSAEEAMEQYAEAKAIFEAIKGKGHPLVANAKLRMGDALYELEEMDEAEREYREALEIFRESMSDQSHGVATSLAHLSTLVGESGRYEEFLALREELLETDIVIFGEESERVMEDLSDLAYYNANLGKLDRSVDYHTRRMEIAKKLHGEDSVEVAFSLSSIAEFVSAMDEPERSAEYFAKSLAIHDQLEGEDADSAAHASVLGGYGWLLHEQERFEEAIAPLQRGLDLVLSGEEPEIEQVLTNQMALAVSLFEVGREEESKPHFREAHDRLLELVGPEHPYTLRMQGYLDRLESSTLLAPEEPPLPAGSDADAK